VVEFLTTILLPRANESYSENNLYPNQLRFDRIVTMSLWPHFFGSTWRYSEDHITRDE